MRTVSPTACMRGRNGDGGESRVSGVLVEAAGDGKGKFEELGSRKSGGFVSSTILISLILPRGNVE